MGHAATPSSASEAVPRSRGEIASLTSLRGFLALWVVAFHFWNDVLRLFPAADLLSPLARHGHLAVPAFFLLSGFVMSYNYADRFRRLRGREVVRFLGLRLARIYPVHFAMLMILAVVIAVNGLFGTNTEAGNYESGEFVLNLFLVQTWVPEFHLAWNHPSWSISSEWFAYLLFPLACATVLRFLTPLRAVVFGAGMLMASVYIQLFWRPWPFYELAHATPLFFAGCAIFSLARLRLGGPSPVPRFVPEALAFGLAAACFLPGIKPIVLATVFGFFALILSLAVRGAHAGRLWTSKPSAYLGEVSYSLYMSHTLMQLALHDLLPTTDHETASTATRAGVLLVYAAAVAGGCLATYYLVERPARSLIRRLVR